MENAQKKQIVKIGKNVNESKIDESNNLYLNLQFSQLPTKYHLPRQMHSPKKQAQNPQKEHPRTPQRGNRMVDQDEEESSTFTQRQIQIIRSYLGNINLNPQQKLEDLSELAVKVRKETQLEAKSAKQILAMIYKLLDEQGALQEIKKPEGGLAGFYQRENFQKQKQPIHEQQQKPAPVQNRRENIQIPQSENIFLTKSLFKSFNDPAENNEAKQGQKMTAEDNKFSGIRKVNLFTKPSVELPKTYASNGFLSVGENNPVPRKHSMDIEHNEGVEFPSFSKKATKEFKQTAEVVQPKSKRKILPKSPLEIDPQLTPMQKIQWIETNTHDCHSIIQKKVIKKTGNPLKDSYFVNDRFSGIFNEYFYSNYDKTFFNQQNHFSKLVNYLGLDAKKMTFREFKLVKSALPKPKLFTIEFVTSQQNRLNEFRSQLRQIPKDRARSQDIQLIVGRQVTALHPVCGHLHSGTILAIYKQNQYMVKFTRPQLGTQKILDINISTKSTANTNKAVIENIDFEAMAVLTLMLEYKGNLLERFKEYNDLMEEMKEEGKEPGNGVLQEYGWIGSAINILSMGMKHIIVKSRIRGLKPSNQQIVGKNFSSLLTNPLNLMSKQLQNSPQQSDVQISNQLKRMVSNRQNTRIQQYLRSVCLRNGHYVQESEMNPQQKENVMQLLKSFIGMLLNLRFQGRNFSIQSNKYLHNIHKLIDNDYTEEFNEIYASVHSIVKKISELD